MLDITTAIEITSSEIAAFVVAAFVILTFFFINEAIAYKDIEDTEKDEIK